LRWLPGLSPRGTRWVGCGASWRWLRLCPSPRDSAFPGHRRVAATDVRPQRIFLLGLRLALWYRFWSKGVLGQLTNGRLLRPITIGLVPKDELLILTAVAVP